MPDYLETQLHDRITAAFGNHDVHPEVRRRIRSALVPGTTWDALPPDIQQLIEGVERSPAQAWDDPSDMPGNDHD